MWVQDRYDGYISGSLKDLAASKVQEKMLNMLRNEFKSIKFYDSDLGVHAVNNYYKLCFKFDDPADEAFFTVLTLDGLEI